MSNSKFLTPKIFDFFFLIFRISIDKFFIFCHIGLQNGLKQSLKIIYQYAIIIWVIFDPIAEILGGGQIDPPQAEWVDLDPPSRIGLKDTESQSSTTTLLISRVIFMKRVPRTPSLGVNRVKYTFDFIL